MVTETYTVAFRGIEAIPVTVQVQVSSALASFQIVGLADKAISEARERVRAALNACGITLPAKRILVSLGPADLPKEGGHYDLPIALGLLAALDHIPAFAVQNILSLGELSLDGKIRSVPGILPAAVTAGDMKKQFICAPDKLSEALWAAQTQIIVPQDLFEAMNHYQNKNRLEIHSLEPEHLEKLQDGEESQKSAAKFDLSEVRGQETAKHALEITAAGGHNLLMSGPPGAGKSMLASCLPDILPPLSLKEKLEVSLVASICGQLGENGIINKRPYRNPHHSASMAALVGGGRRAMPGEISLAHSGILFLDELPEFRSDVLDSLRQPLETGESVIARAEHRVTYPAVFQLVAAMNPCKCGYMTETNKACNRAPQCGKDYTNRVSGPLLDRFDLRVELASVAISDLALPPRGETSNDIKKRTITLRDMQAKRAEKYTDMSGVSPVNARIGGQFLDEITKMTQQTRDFFTRAAEKLSISARGYHRLLRTARTIQDIDDLKNDIDIANETTLLSQAALAGALSFRML
ncbi:MAG: YifB family Mg chelatase-like AAA ATPase [Pseudomonadota bacterium]